MKSQTGFTLIELMITLVIAGVIIMAAYSASVSQQKVYYAQDQVAEMQQNLRSAMALVTSDVRMAGYDPSGSGNFTITVFESHRMEMTADLEGEGNGRVDAIAGETVNYTFAPGPMELRRQVDGRPAASSAIAKNVEAVDFTYLDEQGNITGAAGHIRTVQLTLLVRAGRPDREFKNTRTYNTPLPSQQTWGPFNDNYRRRLLVMSIKCRNMGL